jgi:hypothetical protein
VLAAALAPSPLRRGQHLRTARRRTRAQLSFPPAHLALIVSHSAGRPGIGVIRRDPRPACAKDSAAPPRPTLPVGARRRDCALPPHTGHVMCSPSCIARNLHIHRMHSPARQTTFHHHVARPTMREVTVSFNILRTECRRTRSVGQLSTLAVSANCRRWQCRQC